VGIFQYAVAHPGAESDSSQCKNSLLKTEINFKELLIILVKHSCFALRLFTGTWELVKSDVYSSNTAGRLTAN